MQSVMDYLSRSGFALFYINVIKHFFSGPHYEGTKSNLTAIVFPLVSKILVDSHVALSGVNPDLPYISIQVTTIEDAVNNSL